MFADPASHSALDLILAAYGYAVQIYCDFSAYTDMAIGLAALLGYRFPRNFNQPYRALSLQEFWRRWHITLSQWLRDYLYIEALGGSRGGKLATYRNLMLTMLLGGLWHGANWTFVIWGGLHGGALAVERLWADRAPKRWKPLPDWAKLLITFHVVVLGWIFFRAPSFGDAVTYLGGILNPFAGPSGFTVTPLILLLIVLGLAMHAMPPRWMDGAGDADPDASGPAGRCRPGRADPDHRRDALRGRRAVHLLPVLEGKGRVRCQSNSQSICPTRRPSRITLSAGRRSSSASRRCRLA